MHLVLGIHLWSCIASMCMIVSGCQWLTNSNFLAMLVDKLAGILQLEEWLSLDLVLDQLKDFLDLISVKHAALQRPAVTCRWSQLPWLCKVLCHCWSECILIVQLQSKQSCHTICDRKPVSATQCFMTITGVVPVFALRADWPVCNWETLVSGFKTLQPWSSLASVWGLQIAMQ